MPKRADYKILFKEVDSIVEGGEYSPDSNRPDCSLRCATDSRSQSNEDGDTETILHASGHIDVRDVLLHHPVGIEVGSIQCDCMPHHVDPLLAIPVKERKDHVPQLLV